jgi:hypothetical protein
VRIVNIFKVFKKSIALKLIAQGYILEDIQPLSYKPWFSVFLFKDGKEIRRDFEKIQKEEIK